jgi:Tol biopolymer transport system component
VVGDYELYLPAWRVSGPPQRIVFFSNYQDSNDEIYSMEANATDLRRLTTNGAIDQAPSWGPSQLMIAFHSNRDGQNEIYTMNADGTNVQRLTNNSCDDVTPSWSPVNGRIAWASNCGGADYEIWSMLANGTDQQQLTNNGTADSRPDWSPATNEIAYVTGTSISIMNADGTNSHVLTPGADPAWSPNGQQLVYTCTISGNRELCVIGAGGGAITQLTHLPSIDFRPVWGPGGTSLAFVSNQDELGQHYDVYTMTATIDAPIFRVPSTSALPSGFDEADPDWN